MCAADLAGAESLFPTEVFEDVFALAKQLDIPYTIHAGEAAGPDSIRCALRMGAYRIGHGVHAIDDPDLVKELASDRNLPGGQPDEQSSDSGIPDCRVAPAVAAPCIVPVSTRQ